MLSVMISIPARRYVTTSCTYTHIFVWKSHLRSSHSRGCSIRLLSAIGPKTDMNKGSASPVVTATSSSSSWIEKPFIPRKIRPYLHLARSDKQVGTLLLMWPCFWSVCLAAPLGQCPDLLLLGKLVAGSIIMRSAGCVINDLWDKDFDRHVERTKDRPLARGDISVPQALTFLGLLLSGGLGVLVTLNVESVVVGMMSMPLVVCYPLMKRYTNWPQLFLGLTFNWGALVGYTAASSPEASLLSLLVDASSLQPSFSGAVLTTMSSGSIAHAVPLYCAGVCWTLVYDTLYGYQDRKDDARIGLKSTALTLGDSPQWPLTLISVGMATGLVLTGVSSQLSDIYYFGVAAMWSQLIWQIWSADIHDSRNLWIRFNSNKYTGGVLTLSIIAGHF